MAHYETEIMFKGEKYLLIGGAIATQEQYENGLTSYAHLFDDGIIKRFNKQIGTKKDIKVIGKKKVNVKFFSGMMNIMVRLTRT